MKFFATCVQAARNAFRLVAVLAVSVLIAAAQANHGEMIAGSTPDAQHPAQQIISTNELRAPHKAQAAVRRAREALDRKRYPEAKKYIEEALEIYPDYALALAGISGHRRI